MQAQVIANGTPMGVYHGDGKRDVLDAYARDAGYEDFADLLERVPDASREDVDVLRIAGARCEVCDARMEATAHEERDGEDPRAITDYECPDCGHAARIIDRR